MTVHSRRPTIIDVAKRAGISKSTVARVLSGNSNVSEEARDRVLRAVRESGYEPNYLAVGMRSGRSGMLGLVIPDITNPFWAVVARGAQDRAEERGRSLLIFNSDWSVDREDVHLRTVRKARVEGVIVNRVADRLQDPRLDKFPLVVIGSGAAIASNLSSVGSNVEQGVHSAAEHLWRRGHQQPCLIVGPRNRLSHDRFIAAAADYYGSRGVAMDSLIVEEAGYTIESGQAAMQRILLRNPKAPLAVLAVSDLIALGAMSAAREAGLRCPRDISIIGFDDNPASALVEPGLTSVRKPSREIGARAVDMLVDVIEGRQTGPQRVSLDCVLIERGSVGQVQTSRATEEQAA